MGIVNFVIGFLLITKVGDLACGLTLDALMVALGALVAAIGLAPGILGVCAAVDFEPIAFKKPSVI